MRWKAFLVFAGYVSSAINCFIKTDCHTCLAEDGCLWSGNSCADACGEAPPCLTEAASCAYFEGRPNCSLLDHSSSCEMCCAHRECVWSGHSCQNECHQPPCVQVAEHCELVGEIHHIDTHAVEHVAEVGHASANVDLAMTFLLTSLAVGHFFAWLEKQHLVPIPPFTVCMFLFGLTLSVIFQLRGEDESGMYGRTMHHLTHLHPHVVLLPLLPPLLWESAFHVDWHVFKKVFPSALILAGPGVVINVCFMVLIGHYLLGFSIAEAAVLGSILSATDPVAVVATLTELSAPARLATIIEGESLLNDGTAFVLFTIFVEFVKVPGAEIPVVSASAILLQFLKLAVLGPVFGYVCARLFEQWISSIHFWLIEIALTLLGVYSTFVLAELALHTSGILAIVVFGVYFAAKGKFAFSIGTLHASHRLYSYLGFIANTIIFALSGAVVFNRMDHDFGVLLKDGRSWLLLLMLYVAVNVVRFLSIITFWPILSRIGYGLTLKEVLMMTFGGLRGAIGLSLMLITREKAQGIPPHQQAAMQFYVAGIVVFTLVINGTLAPLVYRKLRIYPVDVYRPQLMKKALQIVSQHSDRFQETLLEKHWFFEDCCWSCVRHLTPALEELTLEGGLLHLEHNLPKIAKCFGVRHKIDCTSANKTQGRKSVYSRERQNKDMEEFMRRPKRDTVFENLGTMHNDDSLANEVAADVRGPPAPKMENLGIERKTSLRDFAWKPPKKKAKPKVGLDDFAEESDDDVDPSETPLPFATLRSSRVTSTVESEPAAPKSPPSQSSFPELKAEAEAPQAVALVVDAVVHEEAVKSTQFTSGLHLWHGPKKAQVQPEPQSPSSGKKKFGRLGGSRIRRKSIKREVSTEEGRPAKRSTTLMRPMKLFMTNPSRRPNQILQSTSTMMAYFNSVKASYARDIERGLLSAEAAIVLQEANDRGSELWTLPGRSNTTLMEALQKEFDELRVELQFKKVTGCGQRMFQFSTFYGASVAIESFAGYCMCHSAVADELISHLGVSLEHQSITKFIKLARLEVQGLVKEYPDCAWMTQACMASRLICVNMAKKVEDLYESGFVSHTDEEHLKEILFRRVHQLDNFRSITSLHSYKRFAGKDRFRRAISKVTIINSFRPKVKRRIAPSGGGDESDQRLKSDRRSKSKDRRSSQEEERKSRSSRGSK